MLSEGQDWFMFRFCTTIKGLSQTPISLRQFITKLFVYKTNTLGIFSIRTEILLKAIDTRQITHRNRSFVGERQISFSPGASTGRKTCKWEAEEEDNTADELWPLPLWYHRGRTNCRWEEEEEEQHSWRTMTTHSAFVISSWLNENCSYISGAN